MRRRIKPGWKPTEPTMTCGACKGDRFLIRMQGKYQVALPCVRCHSRGVVEVLNVKDGRLLATGE